MSGSAGFGLIVHDGDSSRTALLERVALPAEELKPWMSGDSTTRTEWHEAEHLADADPAAVLAQHPALSLLCAFEDGAASIDSDGELELDWSRIGLWMPAETGAARLRVPPFDVADSGHLEALPHIPGATVTVQFTLEQGPFGDLDYLMRIVDGRIEAVEAAWTADAHVFITAPWRTYLELRLGLGDPSEAMGRSVMKGELARMSVVAAIFEAEPFVVARQQNQEMMAALMALGDATTAQQLLAALNELVIGVRS